MLNYFNSVEQVLRQLEKQPGWEKFRDYRQLLKAWHNTVSQNTAQNTRPLHIARQVLWVATNSASRAQELSFQRYTLLKRLNQQLPFTLKDIRFSSSGFYQTTPVEDTRKILFTITQQQKSQESKNNLREIPITKTETDNTRKENLAPAKAKIAAKRWLKAIEQNSQNSSLTSCPICGAPTPTGELERWASCYLCIAQKWSKEYRPPTFIQPN